MFVTRRLSNRAKGLALTRLYQRPSAQLRKYATQSTKEPSAVAQFYKTFTRPVLKVLLMATLTYQITYLFWMKFEQDEIRDEKSKELAGLEAKVEELRASQEEKKQLSSKK